MTFEERLDRISARHEALAQTVEVIAGMQKENERRFAETERRFAEVAQFINQLARVAETHEHRLDRLEGR